MVIFIELLFGVKVMGLCLVVLLMGVFLVLNWILVWFNSGWISGSWVRIRILFSGMNWMRWKFCWVCLMVKLLVFWFSWWFVILISDLRIMVKLFRCFVLVMWMWFIIWNMVCVIIVVVVGCLFVKWWCGLYWVVLCVRCLNRWCLVLRLKVIWFRWVIKLLIVVGLIGI